MTETEGIVERPTDVIGNLEYEINRGGNSATINAMIAARDAIVRLKLNRDFWMAASNTNLDMYNEAMARAKRAEREKAEAVAAEREACWSIAHEMENSQQLSKIEQYRAGFIAAAIRARNGQ